MKHSCTDLTDKIQTALAHISDGLCHPLKIRVETILNSEKDLIVLYAVSNLMRFYQNILNNVGVVYTLFHQH